ISLTPATDRRTVLADARVDDAGVRVLAEGAVHQAWGFGIRDSGFGDAERTFAFANPQSRIQNPGFLAIHRELRALLHDILAHAGDDLLVVQRIEYVADPVGQRDAIRLLVATRGDGRGADTQARGDEGLLRVVGHGVLVDGGVRLAKRGLRVLASDALADHVEQPHVVPGAARDDPVTAVDDHLRHRLRVLYHLLLVGLELRLQRFLERHRLGRDHVHQRAALDAGEDDALQLLGHLVELVAGALAAGDDDAAARA